jgi:phosphoserine phosphatase
MRWAVVAFDVDGTLITNSDPYAQSDNEKPHERIVTLLQILSTFKNIKIVVWSGGGKEYAEMWGHRLGLDEYVWRYASKTEHKEIQPDIAIDDIQDTAIGLVNLIVRNK